MFDVWLQISDFQDETVTMAAIELNFSSRGRVKNEKQRLQSCVKQIRTCLYKVSAALYFPCFKYAEACWRRNRKFHKGVYMHAGQCNNETRLITRGKFITIQVLTKLFFVFATLGSSGPSLVV